jgi:hypothetical protein
MQGQSTREGFVRRVVNIVGIVIPVIGLMGAALAMAASGSVHLLVGHVQRWDPSAQNVTVTQRIGKKERAVMLRLSPEARISRNGQAAMLADLKAGDRITVRYTLDQGTFTVHTISYGGDP